MKLSIGMAHYEDFHGAVFSIQSIRMNSVFKEKDIEIIVIDNSPDKPHGKALANFCMGIGVKYIPFQDSEGTTQTRQAIFDNATGDAVLCMDCHVLLFENGIRTLINFYEQNLNTKDLYSGPLYLDSLQSQSTHFDLLWRNQMWGVWGYTRVCDKCGYKFSYQPARDFDYLEKDLYLSMETSQKDLNSTCPVCQNDLATCVENKLELTLDSEPFQIPSQGLGMFTCMKHAWLGFNPNFRNFGGEEGYIHHKFEQSGHKTMCLPFLGWWHRFPRPDGVKYPLTANSKISNYINGFMELGLPLEDIKNHFISAGGLRDEQEWYDLLKNINSPTERKKPKKCCGGKSNCKNKDSCGCNNDECNKKETKIPEIKIPEGKVIYHDSLDGSTITQSNMDIDTVSCASLYENFKTKYHEYIRNVLKDSKSVAAYIHSGDYAFNVMSLDNIDLFYMHHLDMEQAHNLKFLESAQQSVFIEDFLSPPDTKGLDTLLVSAYSGDGNFSRITNYAKEYFTKNLILVMHAETKTTMPDAVRDFVITNSDTYTLDAYEFFAEEQKVVLVFTKEKEKALKTHPKSLGDIGIGAGTELKKSLKLIGIESTPDCSCNNKARCMDLLGPDWCDHHINLIVDWLKYEAEQRNLPFVKSVVKMILKRVIKRARKKIKQYKSKSIEERIEILKN